MGNSAKGKPAGKMIAAKGKATPARGGKVNSKSNPKVGKRARGK
jgi:hypothetical protein